MSSEQDTAVDASSRRRLRVRIRGAVQGVGFRPHTRLLALEHQISGWVLNDGEGVLLEAEGADPETFVHQLKTTPPPLARIDAVELETIKPNGGVGEFVIQKSADSTVSTSIIPDAGVCSACLEDMFNPDDRRFLYPFINCTHCGPRCTITAQLPYDRANTSMAPFNMCADCASEYDDPEDRRYHAQPTACPNCGPLLSHDVPTIMNHIRCGDIVALKGIGGFHLVCDARNELAVAKLRERKNRDAKPLAVMAANLKSLEAHVDLNEDVRKLLGSTAAPIVICPKVKSCSLADGLAPGLSELGVMVPYAPLHYLLFHYAAGSPTGTGWLDDIQDLVLVMTSANPGGEPLVIKDDEAHERLSDIADLIITHDREILIRADDSVMRIIDGAPAFIRRARGFTPEPIKLTNEQPNILALGAHLKSTICITRGDEAFVSQHIGDLDNPATYAFLLETIDHFKGLLDVEPSIIACDKHPDFLSSQLAETYDLPVVTVLHHHAHIAALAAEHQITAPLLGLSLDGYGYGESGEAWGGELILHEGKTFQRLGHLAPLPMAGGDAAARQPWRMAAGVLAMLDRHEDIASRFPDQPLAPAVAGLLEAGRAPHTSSCGRLFDAVAGLLGVSAISRYEAEPAMMLEALVLQPVFESGLWTITEGVLDLSPLLDRLANLDQSHSAARRFGAELFHGVLIQALADWARQAALRVNTRTVALSGGCVLNRVLAEGLILELKKYGIKALYPRRVPPGDGAISLGQAVVAGYNN